jgi:hypothetical protein
MITAQLTIETVVKRKERHLQMRNESIFVKEVQFQAITTSIRRGSSYVDSGSCILLLHGSALLIITGYGFCDHDNIDDSIALNGGLCV